MYHGCIKLCVTVYMVCLASAVSFRDVTVPYGLDSMEALGRFVGFGDFSQNRGTDVLLTNGTLVWIRGSQRFELDKSHIPGLASRDDVASVDLLDMDHSGSLDAVVARMLSSGAQEGTVEVQVFLDIKAEVKPLVFQTRSKPVVIDDDGDHQLELLALDPFGTWTIWSWNDTANNLTQSPFGVDLDSSLEQVLYADINGDCLGDVVGVGYSPGSVTSGSEGWHLTVWPRTPDGTFSSSSVKIALGGNGDHFVYLMDVDADGSLEVLSVACSNGSLQLTMMSFGSKGDSPLICQSNGQIAFTGKVDVEEIANISCNCTTELAFLDSGDIDLDGYPEALLTCNGRVFLFLNNPCDLYSHCINGRTLSLMDTELSSVTAVTQAVFFDAKDDGVLDVLMSREAAAGQTGLMAFELIPTQTHMFVKVYVPSGDCGQGCTSAPLPGSAVAYVTHDRYGQLQRSVGHFWSSSLSHSLTLPYIVLGLGKAPNFIEGMSVGVYSRGAHPLYKQWTRLIPNAQIRVLCTPVTEPDKWQLQLYLTPSELVWISSAVMTAVCLAVGCVVLVLHLREKFIDVKERKKEPVQFIFDPM